MENVNVIPSSVVEFVELYPDYARRIACRKCIGEYNQVRDEIQKDVSVSVVLWMDTSGLVTKTKEILYRLNERAQYMTRTKS